MAAGPFVPQHRGRLGDEMTWGNPSAWPGFRQEGLSGHQDAGTMVAERAPVSSKCGWC